MTDVIELAHDTTRAKILPGLGMNLFSLVFDGVETLYAEPGFEAGDKRPSSSGIPILFPFPGRIQGTTLTWRGKTYDVAENTAGPNAIHGFCHTRPWTVTDRGSDRVTGLFDSKTAAGNLSARWPSSFTLEATFRLTADTLTVTTTMANTGDEDLPCGLGLHPYFLVPPGAKSDDPARRDTCRVRLPAKSKWVMDQMIATGETMENPDVIRSEDGMAFGEMTFDNGYGDLVADRDGQVRCEVIDASTDRRVVLAFGAPYREVMLYTPGHRQAVCLEPYTCVCDPFRLTEAGVDAGLIVIPPGESRTAEMTITLTTV